MIGSSNVQHYSPGTSKQNPLAHHADLTVPHRAEACATIMMYLVFLGCLYLWYGGSLIAYVQLLLGYDVQEEPKKRVAKKLECVGIERGYASEGAIATKGMGPDEPLMAVTGRLSGGTFTSSYEKEQEDEEERELGLVRGSSVNNDTDDMRFNTASFIDSKQDRSLSEEERDVLKRRTITARLNPLAVVSSFLSDLDLAADWVFLYYVLVDYPLAIRRAGLVCAILGTVMWALSTTEFALLSKLRIICSRNRPLSRLEYPGLGTQLLANVVLEDVPQFAITLLTKPNSISGALNIATSLFSLMAKIMKGITSTSSPSLSSQFRMIDADPAVTRHLFLLADEAKRKAKMAEKLIHLTWTYRYAWCRRQRQPLIL